MAALQTGLTDANLLCSDPAILKLMQCLERNWQSWLQSAAGKVQHERMMRTTMCVVHGDLHLVNTDHLSMALLARQHCHADGAACRGM